MPDKNQCLTCWVLMTLKPIQDRILSEKLIDSYIMNILQAQPWEGEYSGRKSDFVMFKLFACYVDCIMQDIPHQGWASNLQFQYFHSFLCFPLFVQPHQLGRHSTLHNKRQILQLRLWGTVMPFSLASSVSFNYFDAQFTRPNEICFQHTELPPFVFALLA